MSVKNLIVRRVIFAVILATISVIGNLTKTHLQLWLVIVIFGAGIGFLFLLDYFMFTRPMRRLPKFYKAQFSPAHNLQMFILPAVIFSVISFIIGPTIWDSIGTTAIWVVLSIIQWIRYQKEISRLRTRVGAVGGC